MKIVTINANKWLQSLNFTLGAVAFILILALVLQGSSLYFSNKALYAEEVAAITDNKTIIIDAGHGGEDCGTIGANGKYEKDLNLALAFTLGQMLTDKGYAVVYTRTEDKLLYTEDENIKGIRKISDLKNRCKIADEYPGAIFISIHMNSFTDPKYSGTQVYYSGNSEHSRQLAQKVQSNVVNTLQKDNNRTVKEGKSIYILKNIENVGILIECGFLSNPEECEKLSEKEYQNKLCFSIMCAMIEYIENKNTV